MEAGLLRTCVIATFKNIGFDSNAVALRHHHTYDVPGAHGTVLSEVHWCKEPVVPLVLRWIVCCVIS
jgi:hypothetical protein